MWNQDAHRFEFHPGAVFTNIVVGDEINRASPKTQSALLEVMEEQQVTVDSIGYKVPLPFMVIATQNPVDLEGTYRLPEAQLDRFLMRIAIGYPDEDDEVAILDRRASEGVAGGHRRRHHRPDQVDDRPHRVGARGVVGVALCRGHRSRHPRAS